VTALTIPDWPPASNVFFVRAAQVYNAWKGYGVSDNFAIAMLTQAEFESAFNPAAVGDNETAYNLHQWHWNPRGASICIGTDIDVRTETSIMKIVSAAWWELNNTEKNARDAILAAATVEDATTKACALFEGAGAADAVQRRVMGAQRWVTWLGQNQTFVSSHQAA
jgi:hypothetical protein